MADCACPREHPDVRSRRSVHAPEEDEDLAKLGFTMSYTTSHGRIRAWSSRIISTELSQADGGGLLPRPTLFVNTPDILHDVSPARAVVRRFEAGAARRQLPLTASTAASSSVRRPGAAPKRSRSRTRRNISSRRRDWNALGNINELVCRVNRIRHEHAALHFDWTLEFVDTDNPEVIAYTKRAPDDSERLLVIINLDRHTQHGVVDAPVDADAHASSAYCSTMYVHVAPRPNYVRFDFRCRQGHILDIDARR